MKKKECCKCGKILTDKWCENKEGIWCLECRLKDPKSVSNDTYFHGYKWKINPKPKKLNKNKP